MKFVDEARIYVKAGDGGRGCVSFRREKYVPRGGPDGGDGGKGGDIVLRASGNRHTLLDLKYNQHWKAESGGHGSGNNRSGKQGSDMVIPVPTGTMVYDHDSGELLADLTVEGHLCVAARGGIGGKGNAHFKSSTRQTPRFAQDGMPGEELTITLELKLLADVGVIGFPNVGKSTLISTISAARPKIADYPFTTLTPNLGVVRYGEDESFVVADIPGLIEGAHLGTGLGTRFLRHVERTSLLLHLIDLTREGSKGGWSDFEIINNELSSFSDDLGNREQIVVFSKTDLPDVSAQLEQEAEAFRRRNIPLLSISAATGSGLKELVYLTAGKLEEIKGN